MGFTLIELLIVVTILGFLAAMVIANLHQMWSAGRAEAMATTVQQVRQLIEFKAAARQGPLAQIGYPAAIDADWFQSPDLPYHTWTNRPIIIETVTAAGNEIYPAVKTFDSESPDSTDAWYNDANGAFCVRVPAGCSDARTLEMFNLANVTCVTSLDQTRP